MDDSHIDLTSIAWLNQKLRSGAVEEKIKNSINACDCIGHDRNICYDHARREQKEESSLFE